MEVRKIETIDLAEYGMEGIIEMGEPSLRNRAMMQNALGNCTKTHMVNGQAVIDETNLGDVMIIRVMAFVHRAPFRNTMNDFLSYCDRMAPGEDTRLFDRMSEIVDSIDKGESSPFADSQGVETGSSA